MLGIALQRLGSSRELLDRGIVLFDVTPQFVNVGRVVVQPPPTGFDLLDT